MDIGLLHCLTSCETDIEGALKRFCGNEVLYTDCLNSFLDDPTMTALDKAIESRSWDEAFTAAHALKGLAGNMGFVPLFHATAELVVLIRAGKTQEVSESGGKVRRCYNDVISAIRQNKPQAAEL